MCLSRRVSEGNLEGGKAQNNVVLGDRVRIYLVGIPDSLLFSAA